MLKEKDVDAILEVCFEAVERMASHLENENDVLEGIESVPRDVLLKKIFNTLGATIGNYLYAYQHVTGRKEVIGAFEQGMKSYIAFCRQEDGSEEAVERPTRLIDWVVDNDMYKN